MNGNVKLKNDLIAFEKEIAELFEAKQIRAPVHLSGGNEDALIGIFRDVLPTDWVFSTWRSHYHALLHGVPREKVREEILAGRSMNMNFPEHRFVTSAIVGGILSIATGVAAAGFKTWCFVGDMAASTGMFSDAVAYSAGHDLPITFVVEDNGLATNSPTREVWRNDLTFQAPNVRHYTYTRTYPHVGVGRYVQF